MRHDVASLKPLSCREIEILQQIADGIPTREIAAASNTSLQVIKNHTYRAAQKLGADNRGHLIAVAFSGWAHQVSLRRVVSVLTLRFLSESLLLLLQKTVDLEGVNSKSLLLLCCLAAQRFPTFPL